MIDREKVIEGLAKIYELMHLEANELEHGTAVCELYSKHCKTIADAIALLKEQEPRVMTLDDVCKSCQEFTCDDCKIWDEKYRRADDD